MGFLELVNRWLDHLKTYNSVTHYRDHVYMAKRWVKKWQALRCDEVSLDEIQYFIIKRSKVSPITANKGIRYLRALFNFRINKEMDIIKSRPRDPIPSCREKDEVCPFKTGRP
jgi:site-specific recombinase XerD